MYQTYSLIFWMPARNLSGEEMKSIVRKTVSELDSFYDGNFTLYSRAYKKSACKKIENLDENISKELNKKRTVKDLDMGIGCSFGFFSSFNEDESLGLSFHLGSRDSMFIDNIIIHLPLNTFPNPEIFNKICILFKNIISFAGPYYAFMENGLVERGPSGFWDDKPTIAHTLNYYNKEICNKIGVGKFKGLSGTENYCGGIFLKLLDEPMDINVPSHMDIKKSTEKQLCFVDRKRPST